MMVFRVPITLTCLRGLSRNRSPREHMSNPIGRGRDRGDVDNIRRMRTSCVGGSFDLLCDITFESFGISASMLVTSEYLLRRSSCFVSNVLFFFVDGLSVG